MLPPLQTCERYAAMPNIEKYIATEVANGQAAAHQCAFAGRMMADSKHTDKWE